MKRKHLSTLAAALSLASFGLAASAAGPVRLVRIQYVQGNVLWRPTDAAKWSAAPINLPIRQGAEIWADGGRAELQFDDGSAVRLGDGATATIVSLYSDKDGEFTEVKLNSGTGSFHLKDKYSLYQVDTPYESIKSAGPSEFRCDVGNNVGVAVEAGKATVSCAAGNRVLARGEYVRRDRADAPIEVGGVPAKDSWDTFDAQRDAVYDNPVEHIPSNVALVSSDVGPYGHWHHVHHYGWVWGPTEPVGWQPYHDGSWTWVDPVGWTWVSNEPWGWAPYHYGTWIHEPWGWAWDPGPVNQYWSPAVVDFTDYDGDYCWAPLSPEEVVYPASIGVGFGFGNWWLNFSIGGCATYLPVSVGVCDPFVFGANLFIGPGWRSGWGDRGGPGWDRFRGNTGFIPRNAAFGSSLVSANRFGQPGTFMTSTVNSRGYWQHGTSVMAANRAFSGPISARPGSTAYTPTRTLTSTARPAAMSRGVYRAPVSPQVARTSQSFGRSTVTSARPSIRTARTRSTGATMPASVRQARQSIGFVGRTGQAYRSTRSTSIGSASASRSAARSRVRGTSGAARSTSVVRGTAARNSRVRSSGSRTRRTTGRSNSNARTSNRSRSTFGGRSSTGNSGGRTRSHNSGGFGSGRGQRSTGGFGGSNRGQRSTGGFGAGNRGGGNRGGGGFGGGNRGGGRRPPKA